MNPMLVAAGLGTQCGGRWRLTPHAGSGFTGVYRAESVDGACLFIKTGGAAQMPMLLAEAEGLAALRATHTLAVPEVVAQGTHRDGGWLALEWLDFTRITTKGAQRFGEALAALHAVDQPRFGWHTNNFLGSTIQINGWTGGANPADWWGFFRENRLGAMAERLARGGGDRALRDAVAAVIRLLDRCDRPTPAALIHGDLWSGNWGVQADGRPVIFDPAVSVSDPAAELAMLTLFGAPPAPFWPAYRAVHPAPQDFDWRLALYQLYHLLNHVLLFGAGYVDAALDAARRVLRSA